MITLSHIGKKVYLNKGHTFTDSLHPLNLPKNTVMIVEGIHGDTVHCDTIFGRLNVENNLLSPTKV